MQQFAEVKDVAEFPKQEEYNLNITIQIFKSAATYLMR